MKQEPETLILPPLETSHEIQLTILVFNAISQVHLAVLDVSFAIIKLRVQHGLIGATF